MVVYGTRSDAAAIKVKFIGQGELEVKGQADQFESVS